MGRRRDGYARGGLAGAGVLLLAALGPLACGSGDERPVAAEPAPAEEPEAPPPRAPGAGITQDGHYRIALEPQGGVVPMGRLHAWVVEVHTADGTPFAPKRLAFDGGMPQHDHGFVTRPRVTRVLGPGKLLVEGVKFHMAGDWRLRIELVGPAGADVAIFHVQVDP